MPIEITMPRLSDTMETGTILRWTVSEGDDVSSGSVVADVETDKATMELSVFDDGKVVKILVAEGETVDVGTLIAVLAEEGEDPATISLEPEAEVPAEAEPIDAVPEEDAEPGRRRISPVARRLADEHGIEINSIQGSGPSGRIIKRDVLKAVESASETAASIPPSARREASRETRRDEAMVVDQTRTKELTTRVPMDTRVPTELARGDELATRAVPLSNMRQTIARRLVESSTTIPHYQVSMTFDMDNVLQLRRELNEQLAASGVKLSLNDFLIRSCALAMHEHPEVNASWGGDNLLIHGEVNLGMAISVGEERGGGLVVGVIRNADRKSLRTISSESKALAEKARTRGLTVEEMSDSTFTVSNLGMFGVEHFTAIINPPNSAILAVGSAVQKPVVRNGALTIGHEMTATLSSDHRVIDGAMAAAYLSTLRGFMENPATVLV